jgi:hypothetical protein
MLRARLRLLLAALVVLVLVGVVPARGLLAGPQARTEATTFSGAAAKLHVEALSTRIGSRPAGSANYDAAVQYAAEQLRLWGYQPTLQTFPVETYADRGSQLEVTAGGLNGMRVAADTLVYSVAGQVEAPLVAAGLGQPDELAATDVRGKIALLKRGTLRFSEKVANAAAAGALGVVVYNDSAGRVQAGWWSTTIAPGGCRAIWAVRRRYPR